MDTRALTFPSGYDPKSQAIMSLFAAQLDDQLLLLKEATRNLTVEQLQWQMRPGMNTIGMLLAHLAVVEFFWINVAAQEIPSEPEGDHLAVKVLGIQMDDDGMPAKAGDLHPATLQGKTANDYFVLLDKARAAIHAEMKKWKDSDLESTYVRKRGTQERKITCSWTLYHVLEHFAGHFGQILLLKHLMRDAGTLSSEDRD